MGPGLNCWSKPRSQAAVPAIERCSDLVRQRVSREFYVRGAHMYIWSRDQLRSPPHPGGSVQKRWPYRQINPRLLAGPSFWSLYRRAVFRGPVVVSGCEPSRTRVFFCNSRPSKTLRTFAWSFGCGAALIFLKLETSNRCRATGICLNASHPALPRNCLLSSASSY